MKVEFVMIPRYPHESAEEYAERRWRMLALVDEIADTAPRAAAVTYHPTFRLPPCGSVRL